MKERIHAAMTAALDGTATRASLLGRLGNWKDDESWRRFFDTYWRLIYGTCIKAGLTDAEAQDVVQDTVIDVAKRMPGFRYNGRRGCFRKWLFNQTQWQIRKQFRRRLPGLEADIAPAEGESSDGSAFLETIPDPATLDFRDLWEHTWRRIVLGAALDRLKETVKPKQYEIFDLYVLKERPVGEVMAALGVNRLQIYLTKHRLMKRLKREVARVPAAPC